MTQLTPLKRPECLTIAAALEHATQQSPQHHLNASRLKDAKWLKNVPETGYLFALNQAQISDQLACLSQYLSSETGQQHHGIITNIQEKIKRSYSE